MDDIYSSSLPIQIPNHMLSARRTPQNDGEELHTDQIDEEEETDEFVPPHILSARTYGPESFLSSHPGRQRNGNSFI